MPYFGPSAGAVSPSPITTAVTDSQMVRRLQNDVNSLPPFPGGPISCPDDDGSYYRLDFAYADGRIRGFTLEATGCRGLRLGPAKSPDAIALNNVDVYEALASLRH